MARSRVMFLVRWALFLLLSAVVEVAGVTPVGPVEVLAEAEEALHRPRAARPAPSSALRPAPVPSARVEQSQASLRALRAARVSDPATAGAAVRKLPPPARAASPSSDDH
jgi:hypothetical protein